MLSALSDYYQWLHGRWPVPKIEKLPQIDEFGQTNLKGVYVVGDLTGIPLLKFAADSGCRAVRRIIEQTGFNPDAKDRSEKSFDLVILGGGISGYAAALEAKKQGLSFTIVEASKPFSTVENFPKAKPIYTYPSEMTPEGELSFSDKIVDKESLLASLKQQIVEENISLTIGRAISLKSGSETIEIELAKGQSLRAKNVIVAIGRAGHFRALNVPGEEQEKVTNRLLDAQAYQGKRVLVVGGGDSAAEAAIACAKSGAEVSLSYRQEKLTRPKPDNISEVEQLHQAGKIDLYLGTQVEEIKQQHVELKHRSGSQHVIENDQVLVMTGRAAPLEFFRQSNISLQGESRLSGWIAFVAFMLLTIGIYDWKNFGFLNGWWHQLGLVESLLGGLSLSDTWQQLTSDRSTLLGTLAVSMKSRSFYYTVLYTTLIGVFGYYRIKRRKTPYVKIQTLTLFFIQFIPLFLLPELLLPWFGYNGMFDVGWGKAIADSLFPSYISAEQLAAYQWPEWGHPRAFWHAYGLILAWPLNVYNVLTPTPVMGWLIISAIQTFIIIPYLVYRYGKGPIVAGFVHVVRSQKLWAINSGIKCHEAKTGTN